MRKIRTLKLVLALVTLSFITGFAQEKPVTKLLKSYITNSNQLRQTKQVNNVLALFDDRYKLAALIITFRTVYDPSN